MPPLLFTGYSTVLCIVIAVLLGTASPAFAQPVEPDQVLRINSLKGGFGVPYGGLGLYYEYGVQNFSIYAGAGWRWQRKVLFEGDTSMVGSTVSRTIDASFNYGGGVRFHLIHLKSNIQPRLGLHMGWVGNYFHNNLRDQDYESSVYGVAVTLGAEFYLDPVIGELDLVVVPAGDWIFNEEDHPYFERTLIKVSAGIGIDFGDVFVGRNKRRFNVDYN